jgi:hypothetical protein
MDIGEMHVSFRELAQQMGMQTTRAILMEDIDICLNFAIITKARNILYENVQTLFSDKVAAQNATTSPINGLRTLYREKDITKANISGSGTEVNPYYISLSDDSIETDIKVMMYTGFKVSYNNTTLYDCRLIENDNLGQTLRDFCNRAAKDAPIATVLSDGATTKVNIFTGRTTVTKPELVRVLYIKEPAKVHYDEDVAANNVNCDLTVYLHTEVVELAVQYYLRSISPGSSNNRENNQ